MATMDVQPAAARGGPTRDEIRGLRAWKRFLEAHAVITRRLEEDLKAEHDLALADFDVLFQLSVADDAALRMSDLAERVLLSRSGMTRRIDRLQAAGLVGRRHCSDDRRGSFAQLTPAGAARLAAALPTHMRGVDALFVSRLGSDQLEQVRRAMQMIVSAARTTTEDPGSDAPA